jgi:hypothetical protein
MMILQDRQAMSRARDPNRPFHEPTNAFGGPSTSNMNINPTTKSNMNTNANNNNTKSNRRIKQGKIEVDHDQSCLVVNFEVEIVSLRRYSNQSGMLTK